MPDSDSPILPAELAGSSPTAKAAYLLLNEYGPLTRREIAFHLRYDTPANVDDALGRLRAAKLAWRRTGSDGQAVYALI